MLDDLMAEGAWEVAWDLCEGEGLGLPLPIVLGWAQDARSRTQRTVSRHSATRSGTDWVTVMAGYDPHIPWNGRAWRSCIMVSCSHHHECY